MKNSVSYPHLMKAKILADLPTEKKMSFLNQCSVRVVHTPERILIQGDRPQGMFLVAHGRVDVAHSGEHGEQTVICHIGPGDVVGEIETTSGMPCVATCTALPVTTLLFCPTPLLYEFLKHPVFIRNLAAVFTARIARDNQSKATDQHLTVDERIGLRLRQLSQGSDRIRASQARLAEMVGCSRQTMNKSLGRLRDAGIIDIRKGEVRVLRPEALTRVNGQSLH
ncbi:Crp/Fnr family transcriptional regulator [Salipiger abyssi]|uniref:cAMP-binding protein n=2 Tax=Salipiger abyssi TaxID=1250539 RepID=A0A1P8V0X1_9RHOB|nr:cAMP-binding protein [Salipiger abyssi]